jgi:hypothetical protein
MYQSFHNGTVLNPASPQSCRRNIENCRFDPGDNEREPAKPSAFAIVRHLSNCQTKTRTLPAVKPLWKLYTSGISVTSVKRLKGNQPPTHAQGGPNSKHFHSWPTTHRAGPSRPHLHPLRPGNPRTRAPPSGRPLAPRRSQLPDYKRRTRYLPAPQNRGSPRKVHRHLLADPQPRPQRPHQLRQGNPLRPSRLRQRPLRLRQRTKRLADRSRHGLHHPRQTPTNRPIH